MTPQPRGTNRVTDSDFDHNGGSASTAGCAPDQKENSMCDPRLRLADPAGFMADDCGCCETYIPSSDLLLEKFPLCVPSELDRAQAASWFVWWPETEIVRDSESVRLALESAAVVGLAKRPDAERKHWIVPGRFASKAEH